jgi:hypothetical protein
MANTLGHEDISLQLGDDVTVREYIRHQESQDEYLSNQAGYEWRLGRNKSPLRA